MTDDMTAFERQLASGLHHMGGPGRRIDVMAMVRTSTTSTPLGRWSVITRRLGSGMSLTPTEGGFSMFSAVKFVAAAAVVALFGGFLLSGVLTTRPGDEALPAAVTASASPETEPTSAPDTGTITLKVTDLVGMEGLELVGHVPHEVETAPSGVETITTLPEWDVIHLAIDRSPFSASGQAEVLAGEGLLLWVFAGEPTCDASFIPECGLPVTGDEVSKRPGYLCMLSFDLQPGEHIRIWLTGLPPNTLDGPGTHIAPCPVVSWVREP